MAWILAIIAVITFRLSVERTVSFKFYASNSFNYQKMTTYKLYKISEERIWEEMSRI